MKSILNILNNPWIKYPTIAVLSFISGIIFSKYPQKTKYTMNNLDYNCDGKEDFYLIEERGRKDIGKDFGFINLGQEIYEKGEIFFAGDGTTGIRTQKNEYSPGCTRIDRETGKMTQEYNKE